MSRSLLNILLCLFTFLNTRTAPVKRKVSRSEKIRICLFKWHTIPENFRKRSQDGEFIWTNVSDQPSRENFEVMRGYFERLKLKQETAIDRCMCPISTIGNWKAAKRRFLNKSRTLLRTEKRCKIRVRWRSGVGWPAKFISRDLTLMKPIRCTLTLSKLVFISIRINLILPQSTNKAYNSWSINFRYLWKI